MSISVSREYQIAYGHRIYGYRGNCARLHGHTGRIVMTFDRTALGALDMIEDFKVLDQITKPVLDALDHRMILSQNDPMAAVLEAQPNESYLILADQPTAEILAALIFGQTHIAVCDYAMKSGTSLSLESVVFYESPRSAATVRREKGTFLSVKIVDSR